MVEGCLEQARLQALTCGFETQAQRNGGFEELYVLQGRRENIPNEGIVFGLILQARSL